MVFPSSGDPIGGWGLQVLPPVWVEEYVPPIDREWETIWKERTDMYVTFMEADGTWVEREVWLSKVIPRGVDE